VKVGLVLPQAPEDGAGGTWAEIAGLAAQAEAGGVDSIWLSDHFLYRPPQGPEVGCHEPWSLLAALAARTVRVQLGTLVLATSFRAPGLVAKMAATTDDISSGRLILGLGCGWNEPEYVAFGYPFDHRVGRFEEALQVIVPLLRGDRVTFRGQWTNLDDAVVLPRPRRPPPPVLVAAEGPRMLQLTARYADIWQTAWFGRPDERFGERLARIVESCDAEHRDPASLEVTVGIEVREPGGQPGAYLPLDADAIAAGLEAWVGEGVAHVQLRLSPCTGKTCDVALAGIRLFHG